MVGAWYSSSMMPLATSSVLPQTSIPPQVYHRPGILDLLEKYLSRNPSGPVELNTTVSSLNGRRRPNTEQRAKIISFDAYRPPHVSNSGNTQVENRLTATSFDVNSLVIIIFRLKRKMHQCKSNVISLKFNSKQ